MKVQAQNRLGVTHLTWKRGVRYKKLRPVSRQCVLIVGIACSEVAHFKPSFGEDVRTQNVSLGWRGWLTLRLHIVYVWF